ncbi:hypothetical protein MNBD_ALPHA12-1610 [hydrothermal vent metagenome]|uniref:Uncharacterized protein n=1 Tax=hydrothermal vent metagenome TaxID=652676 RepID=A0A3B0TKR5_9ZZZZ
MFGVQELGSIFKLAHKAINGPTLMARAVLT